MLAGTSRGWDDHLRQRIITDRLTALGLPVLVIFGAQGLDPNGCHDVDPVVVVPLAHHCLATGMPSMIKARYDMACRRPGDGSRPLATLNR